MNYKKTKNYIALSLQSDEYINESIKKVFIEEGLKSGWIEGLGAVYDIELGYYDLNKKDYIKKRFEGEYEITSLVGNVAFLDNECFVHTHTTICDSNFQAFGGHLFDAKISATGEFKITLFDTKIKRAFSDEIGLNLWCLHDENCKN